MSSIIFDRLVNRADPKTVCDAEQEVEEEDYNFSHSGVDSKNFLVNLYKNLKQSNYLNAWIMKEKLDYIVISLYKNHEFSFGTKTFSEDFVREATRFLCQDDLILSYIDDEELPPLLIDVIEKLSSNKCNIFYNGCIVAEIRDYRQSKATSTFFNSFFILLKPTSLSLYNDVKKIINLTNHKYNWDNYNRFKLESKLIYLTSPKLCLDPNPSIGLLSKKLSRKKLIFCNKLFLRLPRKRQKKLLVSNEHFKKFKLHDFLQAKKPHPLPRFLKKIPVDQDCFSTRNYDHVDLKYLAKDLSNEQKELENFVKEEEYFLEYVDSNSCCARLIIYFRPLENMYFGTVLYNNVEDFKGTPNINLGDEKAKAKYVAQFIRMHSDFGHKPIKVVKKVRNEQTEIIYTEQAQAYLNKKKFEFMPHKYDINSQGISSLLPKNNYAKISHDSKIKTTNTQNDDKFDLNNSLKDILINGNSKHRNMNITSPISSNTISLPNTLSLANQQFTIPITSLSKQTSGSTMATSNNIASIDEQTLQTVSVCPSNLLNYKGESDNNLSVTYLPPNFFMSGSTVFTVRPSISNVAKSNQAQQQESKDDFLI